MTSSSHLPVSVLMVTWNSSGTLASSLRSLATAEPPPAELVVVDNASSDDSVRVIEHLSEALSFPVRVESLERNLGFAAGMNRAIEVSTRPFVFLMNPDLRLLPDTLARLHESFTTADEKVYAVGPKLLRALGPELAGTEVLDSAGIEMTRDGRHFDRGSGQSDAGQYETPEAVFGLTGAAVLLRKIDLKRGRVEGQVFDEDFFAYREDVDLAWRMLGFGYRALYEPRAVAYHQRRVTPSRRQALPSAINYHSVKNRFLLRIHHADRHWLRVNGGPSVLRDAVVVGGCLTLEWTSLPAFPWLLRNLPRHAKRRRSIMRRRRVSDKEVASWFS